jgi:DNA-binding IclR family transcriptional regulator
LVSLLQEAVINMPCVSPDGKPNKSGIATLSAIKNGASTPEAVSEKTGQPLFKVRSGLRELVKAELVEQKDKNYKLTPKAEQLLA